MIIDVGNSSLNLLLNFTLIIILCIGLISIIPWRLKAGKNSWTVWLPVLSVMAYIIYESSMPSNWDIRLDLLVIWPVLLITIALGLIRYIVIRRNKKMCTLNDERNRIINSDNE